MSAELAATIVIAALGGLCFLLWNTDGRLDWISSLAAVAVLALSMLAQNWNWACDNATFAARTVLERPEATMVRAAIDAERWPPGVVASLFGVGVLLLALPVILKAARASRIEPPK